MTEADTVRYQWVLPFPSPLHHNPLFTLTLCYIRATSNASDIAQKEKKGTSSGPTSMGRRCLSPQRTKTDLPQQKFGGKVKMLQLQCQSRCPPFDCSCGCSDVKSSVINTPSPLPFSSTVDNICL